MATMLRYGGSADQVVEVLEPPGAPLGAAVLLRAMPRTAVGRRLLLDTALTTGSGYASAPEQDRNWLGRAGRAVSTLRPAGIADIDGERVDVVSDGEMIEAGTAIVVSRVDGNRIVVRRHPATGGGIQA